MKKGLSISLVIAMLLALLPCSTVSAAVEATSVLPEPQYIAHDFEGALVQDVDYFINSNDTGTVTWQAQGRSGNDGSLHYTTTVKNKAVSFPLRTVSGDKYHISMWVKFDEVPNTEYLFFVIYNPLVSDGTKRAWNQFVAQHDTIVAGEWVEVTATYDCKGTGDYVDATGAPVHPDGTIELRIGTGDPAADMTSGAYAYAIDDFYVYPEVQNRADDSNRIIGGEFASETSLNAWTGSNASISYVSDGANGTTGAAKVAVGGYNFTGATNVSIRSQSKINFQYYKSYRLSYWAKAGDGSVAGMNMEVYLTYDTNRADSGHPYEFFYPNAATNQHLTTDWHLYEYDIFLDDTFAETTFPKITFRTIGGTNNGKMSYGKYYLIDEISLVQTDYHDFTISASGVDMGSYVKYQMALDQSTPGVFLYRLYHETDDGDVLVTKGHTDSNTLVIPKQGLPTDGKLRLDIVGADSYGNCTKIQKCYLADISYADAVSLKNDQYLWNNDTETLSATITYQNETDGCSVRAYAVQYDNNKQMVAASSVTEAVTSATTKTWKISAPVEPTATKVKFFAWYENTNAPIVHSCELTKTTSGEFIYVDANSEATTQNGAFATPFKTLNAARDHLKGRLSASAESDIYVVLKGGEYVPGNYETMAITTEECADNKHVIYTSLNSDRAKITGAKHLDIDDFYIYDEDKNIYVASVPDGTMTRQLYVNGIKATRARSPEDAIPFVNLDEGTFANNGLTTTHTDFLNYEHIEDLEIYFTEQWTHQFVNVDTMEETGDGLVHFGFTKKHGLNVYGDKTNWQILATEQVPAKVPAYVENALELLDEEGEWYLDTHADKLYYKPRSFEDMETADIVIPGLEQLLTMNGTADDPVKNISFKNIDFEYATWNYPTTNRAFTSGQHATFLKSIEDDNDQLMDGTIEVYNANHITFDNCDFSKIGSMALRMTGAIQDCNVIGNEFYEIAGTAIHLGGLYKRANDDNPVLNPTEEKHKITHNEIANNYIHKVATEYKSAAAIGVGYPKDTKIRNNDLSDGAYSGMHLGWGWANYDEGVRGTENLVVEKNYIHDFMNWRLYDGGGIYTLGQTIGTEANPNHLRGNYIVDIQNMYAAIYPDEGASGWKISDNVFDLHNYPMNYGTEDKTRGQQWLFIHTENNSDFWMEDNYSTTAAHTKQGTNINYEAPGVYPQAEWPKAALNIIEESGIEGVYQNRFDFGLQTIRMERLVEVDAGKTAPLVYSGISSKNRYVDLSDYEITATSSNPAVARATKDTVTGVSEGTAWITLKILKKDANGKVVHYDEHTFRVVVE